MNFPTWFEQKLPCPRKHTPLWWASIGLLFASVSVALWSKTGTRVFLFPFVPLSFGIALIPIATRISYNILLKWEKQVATFLKTDESSLRDFYEKRFIRGANSKAPIICGFLFNALSFTAFAKAGTFSQMAWYYGVVAGSLLFIINFFCGVVLCAMWFLAKFVWDLGGFDVQVSRHSYGITSTGPVLLKVYFLAAIVWFTISLSAYRSDYSWVLLIFLATPTFIFLSLSFIVIQIPLHERMREFKRKQLNELERILAELNPTNLEGCDIEKREKIEFYRRLEDSTNQLPEWPFKWGSYIGVIGTSLAAMAPTIISYLLQAGRIKFSWFLLPLSH
jgi:hypothetical protein